MFIFSDFIQELVHTFVYSRKRTLCILCTRCRGIQNILKYNWTQFSAMQCTTVQEIYISFVYFHFHTTRIVIENSGWICHTWPVIPDNSLQMELSDRASRYLNDFPSKCPHWVCHKIHAINYKHLLKFETKTYNYNSVNENLLFRLSFILQHNWLKLYWKLSSLLLFHFIPLK